MVAYAYPDPRDVRVGLESATTLALRENRAIWTAISADETHID